MVSGREGALCVYTQWMAQSAPNNVLDRLKDRLLSALHKIEKDIDRWSSDCHLLACIVVTHWSGSIVELEKITQANNLYGCLGIGLRYSEIL